MSSSMQTDIAVIGGGMGSLHAVEECAKNKNVKVTAIFGNNFLEFPMAAAIILADPSEHPKWVCGDPKTFEVKGVNYVYDSVAEVNAAEKVITTSKGQTVAYKVLIVASGSKSPLIQPAPGASLADRFAEVKEAAAAIKAANTAVVYGTGLVGLEIAGDIRARNPQKRVVLVSRDGGILGAESPELRARVLPVLEKMKIEVLKGTAGEDFLQPKLTSGTVPLTNGSVSELQYDIWIPAFAQGPSTDFLKASGALDERGRIAANECLQSTKFPEIFGCSVTTVPLGQNVRQERSPEAKGCHPREARGQGGPSTHGRAHECEDRTRQRWVPPLEQPGAWQRPLLLALEGRFPLLPSTMLLVLCPRLCDLLGDMLWPSGVRGRLDLHA